MSEFKFACPQCQQHIQCGPEYFGREISCPTCNARMVVPDPNPPPPATPAAPVGTACPGCGTLLAPGALLCIQCGFNLHTGLRLQTRTAPAPRPGMGRPGAVRPAPPKEASFLQTPTPYVLLFLLLGFGVFFYFARESIVMALAFVVTQSIFGFGLHITQAIHAFKNEGIGMGFMTLCIPFFSLYYVYYKSDSDILKGLMSVSIMSSIAIRYLGGPAS